MGSVATERRSKRAEGGLSGLTAAEWVDVYRLMYMSRRIDDREILLKRQQKIFFQISGAGHEALLAAAGKALKPGYDWFYPYYRDRALCLALGVTAEEMLLQAVGAAADPASGGRQMPSHWGSQRLNIVSQSSSVATQMLQAVGCAEAGVYLARHPKAAERPGAAGDGADYRAFHNVVFHGDEVIYASIGEGSTSQGEFWESLSTASIEKLPLLFVVEDNGYAISTPVEVNTPMMTSSTARRRSARRTPCAIRCPSCNCGCCARARSTRRGSRGWRRRWMTRFKPRPSGCCVRPSRERTRFTSMSTRRMSILRPRRSRKMWRPNLRVWRRQGPSGRWPT